MKIWNRLFRTVANDDWPLVCEQCNDVWPNMIMLKEDVWLSIAEKEEFLCEECIEKRLGRPLTGWDLKDCPLNHETWPHLMYQVLQHSSYGESYRRMFVDRLFDPMGILLALVRGYGSPSDMGMDDDDPLTADKELGEARRKSNLNMVRDRFGIYDQVNDNEPNAHLKEPAA